LSRHFPIDLARYSAVIFDMDGVLIDSEPIHQAATERILATEGHLLDPAIYRTYIGTTLWATWEDLCRRFQLRHPQNHYERCYTDEVLRALAEPLQAAPGVYQLVSGLRERGVPIALASSSQRAWVEATLRGIGLVTAFSAVVSGDEVALGKPAPDIFLLAARRLGVEPGQCLVIEDSPHGVAAARAAGIDVVAVRTPHVDSDLLAAATLVIDSLEIMTPSIQ
jgi:HAD superfamily hydrolase (TIGR01509 family)